MSKYLGFSREVQGVNKNIHTCTECGNKLTQRDYNELMVLCKPCKRKGYDAGRMKNVDLLGNNKIDEILAERLGGNIN